MQIYFSSLPLFHVIFIIINTIQISNDLLEIYHILSVDITNGPLELEVNQLFLDMLFSPAVNEAGESENIAAEPGPVVQNAVKPPYMGVDKFYQIAYIYHCEKSSWPDNIEFPAAEKHKTAHHGKNHKRGIDYYLHLRERPPRHLAQRHRKALAGHSHRSAAHLKSYADAHHCAAGKLNQGLPCGCITDESRCEIHVKVYEPTEYKAYRKLKEL